METMSGNPIDKKSLIFFVNGKKIEDKDVDPEYTLLYYLRTKLQLCGTKLACGEGGCGACTVMVSKYDRSTSKIVHFTVNACLAPICSLHGLAVTTVEGIGSTKTRLHPVQERMALSHGSQCGFCTPGIVMSMYTLLRNNPQPDMKQLESAFEGNLCRCTGYRPILEGYKTFCKEGMNCCRNKKIQKNVADSDKNKLTPIDKFTTYDPSQEPIFPSELQLTDKYDKEHLEFHGKRVKWIRPVTLATLVDLKKSFPDARLVNGNTEVGVEVKFKNCHYPVIITPSNVPEMKVLEYTDTGIIFGAAVTLSKMDEILKEAIAGMSEYKTRIFSAVVEMLRWFAGHQIRNVSAIGGNIMTASPISDLNPLFMAAKCILRLARSGSTRDVILDHTFFTGYRTTILEPDEILLSIKIPFTQQNEYFFGFKQAHRREDDIAIVNAGCRVVFKPKTNVVERLDLAYGGMAPTTVMALTTMEKAAGRTWNQSLLEEVLKNLPNDLPLPPGVPGGSVQYRRTLTLSLFFKFYLSVQSELQKYGNNNGVVLPQNYQSAIPLFEKLPLKSSQYFDDVGDEQPLHDVVGKPIRHVAATKQATGEARYVDDIPKYQNELYLSLVTSTKAHANIVSVDTSMALALDGVHAYIDHNDVIGNNVTGVFKDETIFAKEKVTCQGQVIGAIVADNQMTSQRAAKMVKIEYEELKPIISIKDAIAKESFYHSGVFRFDTGDTEEAFKSASHVIEGDIYVGGQEHFYMETNATIAVPTGEDREIEIIASVQYPTNLQSSVASALGVSANQVNVRVKRIGGGFGGKETRFIAIALPVAVAATRLNRPVRCMLDRDEDMAMFGTRHPFYFVYKVGCDSNGKIEVLDIKLYSNGGNNIDLSFAVMERAILHLDNCYKIPKLKAIGIVCKTNTPSNTAFRGFGAPQAMLACESLMTKIAETLNINQQKIRETNMYKEGEKTYFGMELTDWHVRRCWADCLERSDFNLRQAKIKEFNSENRWKKRGISILPTKFGIAFNLIMLNQAGALVHIYDDGSVLLTHGGIEMGQGLHTKMIQVASKALGIPISKIHISETSTSTVPNASPTAASCGSDLNGMAVLNACNTILKRLHPIKVKNPLGSWEDWIKEAYISRISLSSTGFYRTPDLNWDWKSCTGKPFNYFTTGVACSEVEIDCLTGDHKVIRTDIVMDIGKSLNPAIDVGQIEGAFMQGYGLFTLEEQRYSPQGYLYTRGPGAYKIPGFGDIPAEFNVSLMKDSRNEHAVYSSKGIGEPPLFLAASVFFAIKDAIRHARSECGLSRTFQLDSPATAEKIRMSCEDQFTAQFPPATEGSYIPWDIRL